MILKEMDPANNGWVHVFSRDSKFFFKIFANIKISEWLGNSTTAQKSNLEKEESS